MEWAQLYSDLSAQLVANADLPWWQDFFVNFYRAFVEGGRWTLYLKGVLTTLRVTALALIMGVLLGVLVAVVRSAHDQQRPGRHNPVLAVLNAICKVYTTVIRGTPMIVQMLIMGSIIFASSRNYTFIGTIALGINSGAYVSEIIRGGLMSLDPGQAKPALPGPELCPDHALHRHSPGLQGHPARPWAMSSSSCSRTPPSSPSSAARSCCMRPRPWGPRPTASCTPIWARR